jgi:hypothetical protein
MVNPCLGDLHTAEDKDQNNQTVVDFLLIDSTFAMEVTWLASDPGGKFNPVSLIPFLFSLCHCRLFTSPMFIIHFLLRDSLQLLIRILYESSLM